MLGLGLGIMLGGKGGNSNEVEPEHIHWYGQTESVTVGAYGLSLASNGGAFSWNQRNVYSDQITVGGEGRVQFKMTGLIPDCDSIFGLASTADSANDYTDIDYAFYRIPNNGSINIVENGAFITSVVTPSPYLNCKIVISGGSVKYYYDNVLVYTSLTAPSGEYKLKASFYNPTAANGTVTSITTR
jgi:hypothetical protein